MMVDVPTGRLSGRTRLQRTCLAAVGIVLLISVFPVPAQAAGKLAWLDDVVQEVVTQARAESRLAVRSGSEISQGIRSSRRLFAEGADEGLETFARRWDDVGQVGRRIEQPSESLLRARFARLVRNDPEAARTFAALAPAEKRLVVGMGETAQSLARRYPAEAETMIRKLGPEGLSAVRTFGDDVAETLVREGPESVGVLRKTGRAGWSFLTTNVLPHKKKLAAAGVLAAFWANPEKFVDYAGRATEFAVREFAKAGIELAGAIGGGASRGLESSIAQVLDSYGLNFAAIRYAGMGLAGVVVILATMVVLGFPSRWLFRPLTWPIRALLRKVG
jgi:hypothetical protein